MPFVKMSFLKPMPNYIHPLRSFPYAFQIPEKEWRAYISSGTNWYESLEGIKDVGHLGFCAAINKK